MDRGVPLSLRHRVGGYSRKRGTPSRSRQLYTVAESAEPGEDALPCEGTRRISHLFERISVMPCPSSTPPNGIWSQTPDRSAVSYQPNPRSRAHLGLLRGSLDRLGALSAGHVGLRPFVEHELCVADVPSAGFFSSKFGSSKIADAAARV